MTVDLTRWFAGIVRMGQGERPTIDVAELDTRVHAAVNTLPVTMFEVDAEGNYTCAAGSYINLFGISPNLLIGRSIFDFPKFVPGKNVMVRRALAGESVSFTGIWPRGRFMIRLVPRRDRSGRVCAVVGLGFDLAKPTHSDRHFEDLLEALRQSEARFRAMCDCAPLGILVSSKKLELAYANPALCTLLGRRPEELLGRRWVELLPPEEQERVRLALTEERAKYLPDTLRFERPDGVSVWTSLRMAAMRDDGELLGYVAVVADITQERAARLAIDAAQQDLRRVIEGSPEGIAVVRDGRWIFVNRALVQTLGYSQAEALLGGDVNEIVHPEDRSLLSGLISEPEALLSHGETRELRCRGAQGEYVLLEMRPSALSEFEGAPALLISARDITEKKKLQARLAVTERLLAVGTLAAGVAHEINNPLSAALSNLEWVAGQLDKLTVLCSRADARASTPRTALAKVLPPELTSGLERLVRPIGDTLEACGRVKRIVQDLKLLSRAHEERLGPVELTEVIDSAVRMAWNELRHRARLVREYDDLPLVHGSEARLAQVFLNLLINATQAIPEGDAHRHEIRIAARALGPDRVLVEVRDTGSGIPADILGRIFDPFFTTKPPGIGTGLGLSICQRIVTGMGGHLEVESRVGSGSTFRITLASSKACALEAAPEIREPEANALTRARVLVIDDDAAVGSALELVLADDYEVEVLTNAQRALERLRGGQNYGAILCDLMMPELSGMEFHRELARSHPALATQVIFLTGGAFTAGADEFLDSVPNPRMGKPFNTRELRALIAHQLRLGGAARLPASSARALAQPRYDD